MVEFHTIQCPFCGEYIDIPVDRSAGDQQYVEDCQVCCQPMAVSVVSSVPAELAEVTVWRDD